MANSEHVEIESKFEVDADAPAPDLTSVNGLTVDESVSHSLSAVYLDTEDFALTRHRITLRRRTGGDDEGWHLKLPAGEDGGRRELRAPLGTDDDGVPRHLLDVVLGLVRRRPLLPVARIDNTRHLTVLRDAAGAARIEFCDDHVSTATLVPSLTSGGGEWREWEAEIVDPTVEGARDDLAAVTAALLSAGASPSRSSSKLSRALGPIPPVDDPFDSPVHHTLAADVDQLLEHDPGARAGTMVGVHQARVAVRGLRSTFGSYASELEGPAVDAGVDLAALASELKVLAAVLGRVRDVQVVDERLGALCDQYPPELVGPAVRSRISTELRREEDRARTRVAAAMTSDRYLDLLDSLLRLTDASRTVGAHPATPVGRGGKKSGKAPDEVVLHGVDRQFSRFTKARSRTERDLDSLDLSLAQREELSHVVRKRAKALRRNVNALPQKGNLRVAPLRTACNRLHTVLGDIQDSVTTRAWLRRIALRADAEGESTFGLGVLFEHERGFSERALQGFESDAATVTAAYRELAESRKAQRKKKRRSGSR